jgi:glutathione S-transferase
MLAHRTALQRSSCTITPATPAWHRTWCCELGVPFNESTARCGSHRPNLRLIRCCDGDLVLYESAAICLHLADRRTPAWHRPWAATARPAYKWLMWMTNTLYATR